MSRTPTPGLPEIKRDHGRKTPNTKPPRHAGCRRWRGSVRPGLLAFAPILGVVTTFTMGLTAESHSSSCSPPALPASWICCPVSHLLFVPVPTVCSALSHSYFFIHHPLFSLLLFKENFSLRLCFIVSRKIPSWVLSAYPLHTTPLICCVLAPQLGSQPVVTQLLFLFHPSDLQSVEKKGIIYNPIGKYLIPIL